MVYFHGGGWVLGNINSENNICTHMCSRANCVVISVDYRLAPEDPFPAAVHDAWEAVLWASSPLSSSLLHTNVSKLVISGSSAGGNLAAIMCHKAALLPVPITFLVQLFIVPVIDNTASPETNATYKSNEFTAALPAVKMLWYRKHYLPNEADWSYPEASPIFYEGESWTKQPRALVVVGELDVLRQEGVDYADKLKRNGVSVEVKVMKGMPHPFLAMDAVLKQGVEAITFMCEALKEAFA